MAEDEPILPEAAMDSRRNSLRRARWRARVNRGPVPPSPGLRPGTSGIHSARRSIAMRTALILCCLSILAGPPPPTLAEAAPGALAGKPVPALDLFAQGEIPRVRLELPADAMERLRASPRKYVLGTVVEGARRYTNVSIRLKGGPGSFRPLDDHPAFTVNFDRQAPGQTFHGLKKLHLNNSVQDTSYLSE